MATLAMMLAQNYGCLLAGEKQSIASPEMSADLDTEAVAQIAADAELNAKVAAIATDQGDSNQNAVTSTRPTQQNGNGNVSIGDRITTNDPKLIIAVVSLCLGYVEWRAYRYGYKRNRRKRLMKEKKC